MQDDVHYPPKMVTVGTQTTLTVADVTALEEDNQKRIAELAEVHVANGYPSQEDFKGSEKVLCFYTGLSSFTILMALVSVAVPEGGAAISGFVVSYSGAGLPKKKLFIW